MSSFTRSTLQLIYDQSLPLGVTTVHLPSFSQIFPDFPSSGLLYVLSFLTILAILFRTFPRRKPNATETCTILRNLQKIITPTQSIWYPEYVKLAERASLSRSKTLTLPLDRLITDVIGGRTEFRDAALHLPDLLLQSAQRSESPVLIGVRMSAWYRVVTWMFTARSNRVRPRKLTSSLLLSIYCFLSPKVSSVCCYSHSYTSAFPSHLRSSPIMRY
ncbi:hypothetical protein JAAARDRAFT_574085 [Jaapia argillacea MUCL 33604]|uniref:Uncharacterized protein n=1 Tax=Jaapia argillacea MUCL 33604 TaxID=933084 RepID=A0A067Q4R6_9AGAM|nr:hypothetical protein JAAARDRAFT_574085 [Jaapia argillacea MUCL 33604]